MAALDHVLAEIAETRVMRHVGRVVSIDRTTAAIEGLSKVASVGDVVSVDRRARSRGGEVVGVAEDAVTVLSDGGTEGLRVGDRVLLDGCPALFPAVSWIGRMIDPSGRSLDGRHVSRGRIGRRLHRAPPPPVDRRGLGPRLETGLRLFNTILPIAHGQRIGLFAGSGVGKTTLLAQMARGIDADVVVVALVGERGREVREFVRRALGPEGMMRAVVVAATSDRSPLERRRCLPAAVTIAEYFRDQGRHVLLIADSVTRFAEAHREVALAAGEAASLDGFPPSMLSAITSLAERTGPGAGGSGDITAIFSVLVAASDMEGPVADTLRGVLDGHVVLDREIAERGRFPAVDVSRSVSRCLPDAGSANENASIAKARAMLSAYERAELMIQAGLYVPGSDPVVDRAIDVWPRLERFFSQPERANVAESFRALEECLDPPPADEGSGIAKGDAPGV